jgi:diguanylate cyclase (GGDEF)-like protein
MKSSDKANAYFVLVATLGGLSFWRLTQQVSEWRWREALILLPLYIILSQLSVRLPSGMNITPVYPFVAASMVTLGPAHALAIAIPPFLARVVLNREKPLFVLYICGQLSVVVLAASTAFGLAGGSVGRLELPLHLAAFLVMGFVFDAVNLGLVQVRLTLSRGTAFVSGWLRAMFSDRGWVMPIYHALGLVSSLLYLDRGVWGLIIGILPLFGLHAFFKLHAEAAVVRQAALTDRLTGIGNYRALTEWLARNFPGAPAERQQMSVLSMDIDGMKSINDTYGHEAGNEVLKAVALVLEGNTRHNDVVARYGGDEFVVVLTATGPQDAAAVRDRITQALHDLRVEYNGQELAVGLSIGLASYPNDAATSQDLLVASDRAMYEVKKERRAAATYVALRPVE